MTHFIDKLDLCFQLFISDKIIFYLKPIKILD